MNRRLVLFLAIVILSAVWSMQNQKTTDQGNNNDTPIERNDPDMYGHNVLFSQLREDGQLHYRLRAKTIRQFDSENLTRMEVPRLHLRPTQQPPWEIRSSAGSIRKTAAQDGTLEDVVFLSEQVNMLQNHPVNGTITLRSDSFYLYPDRQYAQTHQDVTIDTAVGRTTAAGLKADFETGVLTLSSSQAQRVHTIVLPAQFKKS